MNASTKEKPVELSRKWKHYGLRTCNTDGTAYGGFIWPETGIVECPDWDARADLIAAIRAMDTLDAVDLLTDAWEEVATDATDAEILGQDGLWSTCGEGCQGHRTELPSRRWLVPGRHRRRGLASRCRPPPTHALPGLPLRQTDDRGTEVLWRSRIRPPGHVDRSLIRCHWKYVRWLVNQSSHVLTAGLCPVSMDARFRACRSQHLSDSYPPRF